MKIIRGIENLTENYQKPVVTIGNFDGVHIGHQKILRTAVESARRVNGTSVAITFDPHPMRVLAPDRGVKMMTSFEEKARVIARMGIQVLLCIDFNHAFSHLTPDEFIHDVLVEKLHPVRVVVGHNYRFGRGKKGTPDFLRRRGKKYGFAVNVVRHVRKFGSVVSSSRIRSLLLRGRVCEAASLLGRAYFIEGNVVSGAGRGAEVLETPTANLTTPSELVPREGVYAVKVGLDGSIFDGVANIGTNPTFGMHEMSYEVHLFGYSGNLLGRHLKVYFIDRLRDERTYENAEQLKVQIAKDIETAKFILEKQKRVDIDL
ncbi:MAG: bifunctional riboflavin kinase/FAD synthetase [bacterium]